MRWRKRVASALVLGAAAGCQSGWPVQAIAQAPPAEVSRAQQPDGDAAKPITLTSFLDKAPDPAAPPSDSRPAVRIRATVGNVPILDEEVREACIGELRRLEFEPSLSDAQKHKLQADVFKQALEELINREVVLQDAHAKLKQNAAGLKQLEKLKEAAGKEFDRQVRLMKAELKSKANVQTDEEFKQFLRTQGLSLDNLRRQKERDFIYTEYLRFLVMPALERLGHEQVADYYRTHPEQFQTIDGVQWQDFFIDASKHPTREAARQFAEQLAARARAGEDFAQLAKQYDQGDARFRNFEGTGRRRGEVRPFEAEPVLFRMRDGDVAPPVELSTGFHVLRLVKREYAGQLPLDEKVQTQIRNKLKSEVFNREAKRVIDNLRRKTQIQYTTQ